MKHFHIWMVMLGAASAAHAEDDATAAYARGQSLLKANKVHEACDAFAAAEKARPGVDTELALGGCFEQDGKLVAAARMYRASADKDVNASRKKSSLEKAGKLDARAPKLRFAINPKPDGLVIKVDGMEVPASGDVMVDVGPHEVTASAPGYTGHANAPIDREGQTLDVILRMEATQSEREPAPPPKVMQAPAPAPVTTEPRAEPMPEPAAPSRSSHRTTGLVVGGVGVAALVGAVVLFEVGTGKLDDEHALCPGHLCASDADTARANSLRDDGRTWRGAGVGVGIGGAVLVAAGTYLFMTSPRETSPVALRVDAHGAAVSYTVGF